MLRVVTGQSGPTKKHSCCLRGSKCLTMIGKLWPSTSGQDRKTSAFPNSSNYPLKILTSRQNQLRTLVLSDTKPESTVYHLTKADNPVMSVVTFLASAVGPAVAAAAAQSALGELANGLKKRKHAGENGETVNGDETKPVNGDEVKDEAMAVDDVDTADPVTERGDGDAPSRSSVERAASIALGAAAAKASALSKHESTRIAQLVSRLVAAQTRKVELKLTMFERLEEILEEEKRNVELGRQRLFKERLEVKKQLDMVEGLLRRTKEGQAGASVEADVAAVKSGLGASTSTRMEEVKGEVERPGPGESTMAQL